MTESFDTLTDIQKQQMLVEDGCGPVESVLRIREHNSIMKQAECAERVARATEKYTRLSFWLLVWTSVAALGAVAAALIAGLRP
jgi:hypothetical protein